MPTFAELAELLQRPPITWWDVLDIAIVSVVVYELLKLIRGTRAVPLAVGIALVVGLFYFSQGLQLDTLSMGMSADLDEAVRQGATVVRVGTAIFGERR